jgi:hypothetical protein
LHLLRLADQQHWSGQRAMVVSLPALEEGFRVGGAIMNTGRRRGNACCPCCAGPAIRRTMREQGVPLKPDLIALIAWNRRSSATIISYHRS